MCASCVTLCDRTCEYCTEAVPTPAPTACFPRHSKVLLPGGGEKAAADLRIGDAILTVSADGRFEEVSHVVALPHSGAPAKEERMVEISARGRGPYRRTLSHLDLASRGCAAPLLPTRADGISVGDCIAVRGDGATELVPVVGTRVITQEEAVGSVVPANDLFLVVDGVLTSPHGADHVRGSRDYDLHRGLYWLGLRAPLLSESLRLAGRQWSSVRRALFGSDRAASAA